MPVVNVASQGEFIIDKTFQLGGRTLALYTNGLVQEITDFDGVYDYESIELPEPIVLVEPTDFANASDEQISSVIARAKINKINLHDYWTVGDTRTVTLPAMTASGVGESHVSQDVEYVILHDFTKDGALGGIQPASGSIGFLIGQKDCLKEGGYMNSTNTNSGSWNSSARRTWCNNTYYNALPTYFKNNAVNMSIITAATYNGSSNQTTTDKVALFAEGEIFDARSQSNQTEYNALTQVQYYKTAANRIKKLNGSANAWWERSPYYSYATAFCLVNNNGSANYAGASYTHGLAPFFCI